MGHDETGFNIEKLEDIKLNVHKAWYRHPSIYDEGGRYKSYNLLLLGFLHCKFKNTD